MCLAGDFSVHTALLIILAGHYRIVYYTTLSPVESEQVRLLDSLLGRLYGEGNGLLTIHPELFQNQNPTAYHHCDSIHVIESNEGTKSDSDVQQHVELIMRGNANLCQLRGGGDCDHLPLKVIWEHSVSTSGHGQKQRSPSMDTPEVDWLLSGTWHSPSQHAFQTDSQGFIARTLNQYEVESVHTKSIIEIKVGQVSYSKDVNGMAVARTEAWNGHEEFRSIIMEGFDHMDAIDMIHDQTIVISYTCRVFAETARGLQQALVQLGYKHTVLLPDVSAENVLALRRASNTVQNRPILQIAIAPHEPTMLLPDYIAIQMEQMWSPFFGSHYPRFEYVLNNSRSIWTFSTKLMKNLVDLGYPKEKCFSVPILTDTHRSINMAENFQHQPAETFDAYMFGSGSLRRAKLIQDFVDQDMASTPHIKLQVSVGGFAETVFDDDLDFFILHALVVLNIHTEAGSSLELHRINHLMSMGKCIVSERSRDDPELDATYADAIVFVDDEKDIYEVVRWLVDDEEIRHSYEKKAFNFYHNVIAQRLSSLEEAIDNTVVNMLFE